MDVSVDPQKKSRGHSSTLLRSRPLKSS